MRRVPFALALGGLVIVVAGLLAGRAAFLPVPSGGEAQPPERESEPVEPPMGGDAGTVTRQKAVRVRPVAPGVVAIPPIEPEELVRAAPREPLGPFGQPLPPPKVDNSRIYRPVADAAGRILGQGLLVTIAGVDIVEPEEVCTDPEGFEWPCGMRARTAFRGLLRGRAVTCDVPPDYEGETIATACTLGKLDLGRWIVVNGWGRAEPGGPYEEQEQAAREADKGIFGSGPPQAPVFTTPPDFMSGG